MQGKPLAQKNKKRKTSRKPQKRTRRMLPDNVEAQKQAIWEEKQAQKQAKLEEKQAQKQAKMEAKQAKKQAREEAKRQKREEKLEQQASGGINPGNSEAASLRNNNLGEPPEPERKRVKINYQAVFKYTFILLAISAALSVALLFVLDWTGWRTSAREKIVSYLIAKEQEALTIQMTADYDAKLQTLLDQNLAQERQALAQSQADVSAKETGLATREEELNARQAGMDKQQSQLDTDLADLEAQRADLEAQKQAFENKKLEIANLAKVYASMERENAAAIISAMDDRQLVISIFMNMKKDDAAEILELMDTQKAADIISEMGK